MTKRMHTNETTLTYQKICKQVKQNSIKPTTKCVYTGREGRERTEK